MEPGTEQLLEKLSGKYARDGQNLTTHLDGLYHAKYITYWDYVLLDNLLCLQKPRTNFPDEMVFIMYHQVNELLFKMILWEIEQVAARETPDTAFFSDRLMRISRYFDMLSSSFDVMKEGMEKEQYLQFRSTLTPASGFQSAQYRLIEFCSTDAINLVDFRFRAKLGDASFEQLYEHLYWQAAGKDHATGKRSTLLQLFEEKYKAQFLSTMQKFASCNLWAKFKALPESDRNDPKLVAAMRHYDFTVNISWVMAHYHAAERYLESDGKTTEATGGSDWKKYMHPKFQRRIFFPGVWSKEELETWGTDEMIKNHSAHVCPCEVKI